VATHCNILAWRIPWTEEPGGLQSVGHKDSDTTEVTHAWMNLEGTMLSEMSQRRTNISLILRTERKKWKNTLTPPPPSPTPQKQTHRCREQMDDYQGKGKGGWAK